MKLVTSILFLFLLFPCFGQLAKGDWMIGGSGSMINQFNGRASETVIQLEITPGYFFLDRWLLGGGIGLQLTPDNTTVSNQAFIRYYLKDSLSRRKMFLEGRWEKEDFSPLGIGLSNRRITSNEFILSAGVNYFLTPFLAIEAAIDYKFIRRYKQARAAVQRFNPIFEFDVGLQYFFRYKDIQQTRNRDFRSLLEKGNWLIKGDFDITLENEFENRNIQSLQLGFGRFMFKNLALGSSMFYTAGNRYREINFGLGPFLKYFLNAGKKSKLYTIGQMEYGLFIAKSGVTQRALHQVNYSFGFGLSNFINEEVSFDIGYRFNRNTLYRSFISEKALSNSNRGLVIGLNYFIVK